jgi:hypothetical protein
MIYLVVAFMDPGYVTSYVLRGVDEYEDDIEEMRYYNKEGSNKENAMD